MSVSQACRKFFESRKSLILGTLSDEGVLETSATPFVVIEEGELAIFVSELSAHTQNLLHSTGLVSGLLVADESETPEMFARERISLQLQVSHIGQDDAERDRILDLFSQRFGEVVDVLRGLPDFHCFKLKVAQGRYIQGFGSAHAFEGCPCRDMKGIKGR
ncbi:HugZ family protein [Thiomicrorhabdus sp. ZW0627]|uniref:HugZ family pyridoxamine 5'-phosphate oxidase n=1 Tax=Thiomicrorhabdus sp. ZW0627 TaxID=3039774 RepID=UPI002436C1F3|nr:HugZ family protein [Thiomicrorhabdus sp. ZW0627]MDG6773795.1 HugZ family protein [Thiomicrorhabdus sp. ZW0627]